MQVCAGAVMCGVTRLSVTLAIILFEMTGSLDHVLPFSLAVLVSKWTADAIEPLSIYVCFRLFYWRYTLLIIARIFLLP